VISALYAAIAGARDHGDTAGDGHQHNVRLAPIGRRRGTGVHPDLVGITAPWCADCLHCQLVHAEIIHIAVQHVGLNWDTWAGG